MTNKFPSHNSERQFRNSMFSVIVNRIYKRGRGRTEVVLWMDYLDVEIVDVEISWKILRDYFIGFLLNSAPATF